MRKIDGFDGSDEKNDDDGMMEMMRKIGWFPIISVRTVWTFHLLQNQFLNAQIPPRWFAMRVLHVTLWHLSPQIIRPPEFEYPTHDGT